ncbi:type II toxin-antitoxin system VapC family toxin [Leifsonia sp. NPDC014704]|uniref:type II toxin-antitoxin system VapC family toxin n=1 Tax=unclassified Leifsonia TaxID=2663824 RepID=UPI0005C24F5E|nr:MULTISPECIES: type II toxin-antitoxin system VapC family toxin [unclassified Leifsonia]TDP99772.1 putative nucleic acid-binding protein [Leifsonia sp. 115AMFTsu3.1]
MTLVLDASVLIGLLNPKDEHHAASKKVFESERAFLVHPVNFAEALIRPHKAHLAVEAFEDLRRLGVVSTHLSEQGPLLLAQLQIADGLSEMDACALGLAVDNDIPLVTFDKRLAAAARKRGLHEPISA